MVYNEPLNISKGIITMNENELTGTQTFLLFGIVCLASAVAVGYGFKKISDHFNKPAPFYGYTTDNIEL